MYQCQEEFNKPELSLASLSVKLAAIASDKHAGMCIFLYYEIADNLGKIIVSLYCSSKSKCLTGFLLFWRFYPLHSFPLPCGLGDLHYLTRGGPDPPDQALADGRAAWVPDSLIVAY
jgi:hypothetical protein